MCNHVYCKIANVQIKGQIPNIHVKNEHKNLKINHEFILKTTHINLVNFIATVI